MILAIDVGNTNTGWGLYEGRALRHYWRTKTDRQRTADELAVLLSSLLHTVEQDLSVIDGVVIGSVVAPLRLALSELCVNYLGCRPLFVGPQQTGGVELRVKEPRQVGADRIANTIAAYARYRRSVIIVDFGTATNFDVVADDGAFIGGAIAPGVVISTEALYQKAAALPRIDLRRPPSVIGDDTLTNMQSGILFGTAALVDGMVLRIRSELGDPATPAVATGGIAPQIVAETSTIDVVEPHLTLDGLRMIYERCQQPPEH